MFTFPSPSRIVESKSHFRVKQRRYPGLGKGVGTEEAPHGAWRMRVPAGGGSTDGDTVSGTLNQMRRVFTQLPQPGRNCCRPTSEGGEGNGASVGWWLPTWQWSNSETQVCFSKLETKEQKHGKGEIWNDLHGVGLKFEVLMRTRGFHYI